MNLLIKQVKRSGRGFRSFANYRLRILLAGGRRQRETSLRHEHSYSPSQVGRIEPDEGSRTTTAATRQPMRHRRVRGAWRALGLDTT